VPEPGTPLEQLGFLTIGLFDATDPGPGHESVLEVIELGERLGYDSAWLRHRHLQYGISSPLAILAAASQRTSRIELGTAVTPLGWENPLRLAEDLATVDVLSGGRLNPGVSVGEPRNFEHFKVNLYPDSAETEDFTYERVARLLRAIEGEPVSTFHGVQGIETFSERVEPHSPGLRKRVWYGGASLQSARWAGLNGLNFLSSSVVKAEPTEGDNVATFAQIQRSHIEAFRGAHPDGETARASQGLVVIPTDRATRTQKSKYQAYVDARTPRTISPQGPDRLMFALDVIGNSDEIAETLYADAGFREVREVVFALPFSFDHEDYVQIITDIAERVGPALGWEPKTSVP
jgi:alkanesulfonate monooxygenase SsuD/methylene tetrahydromethanopterin reductase-like flavin-dependent oxidoreductase (luciferase family)